MNPEPVHRPALQPRRLRALGARQRVKALIKKSVKPVLRWLVDALNRRPRARAQALRVVSALGLDARLRNLLVVERPGQVNLMVVEPPRQVILLTPRAKEILQDLRRAVNELGKP